MVRVVRTPAIYHSLFTTQPTQHVGTLGVLWLDDVPDEVKKKKRKKRVKVYVEPKPPPPVTSMAGKGEELL